MENNIEPQEMQRQLSLMDFWFRMLALALLAVACVGIAIYFSFFS